MKRSIFLDYMGYSPMTKVLDYLLSERDFDFTLSDIVRNAKVGRATLYRLWKTLLKNGLVRPTRKIGNAKLFILNKGHPVARKLIELDDMLIMSELKKRSMVAVKQKAKMRSE